MKQDKALNEIQSLGGRVVLYTNGRPVDPDSLLYDTEKGETCLTQEGSEYMEKYGTSPAFRVACLSSASYRTYFISQVARFIREYGGHGIQIDQIGCNFSSFCFSWNQEHTKPSSNFV
jgi:hypothetical protein